MASGGCRFVRELLDRYAGKLVSAGLVEPGGALLGGLDAELEWNRSDPVCTELEKVFDGLEINSLLYAEPAEPYRSIISFLCESANGTIHPVDCETRTFIHDLPVVTGFDTIEIIRELRRRKSVIVPDHGIITWGTVSPEQAFIFYSTVCFACFVKFFSDYAINLRSGTVSRDQQEVFEKASVMLDPLPYESPELLRGPFRLEEQVLEAIASAGRKIVEYGLVDSFFGNISFLFGGVLYISQTTSSLDELEGCIDPCPMDGSSCVSITASSEYTAHRMIVGKAGVNGILHGHPKFSVIMSMLCDVEGCSHRGMCHVDCPEKRLVGDVPIVPGEVGTGPRGLCNTLPTAIAGQRGVIVWGHGLFTPATDDFNGAFRNMLEIERMCREKYFERVGC
jgi:ribulose-5-phosphate 4-epimerase/fuculose-1-phosphate aldolase